MFEKFLEKLYSEVKKAANRAWEQDNFEQIIQIRRDAEKEISNFIAKIENKTAVEGARLELQRAIDMALQSYAPINKIRLKLEKEIDEEVLMRHPHNESLAAQAKMEGLKALETACRENDPVDNVRAEMQKALDIMWESKDPKVKEHHKKMFPNGKPTLEQFLKKLADIAREQ